MAVVILFADYVWRKLEDMVFDRYEVCDLPAGQQANAINPWAAFVSYYWPTRGTLPHDLENVNKQQASSQYRDMKWKSKKKSRNRLSRFLCKTS